MYTQRMHWAAWLLLALACSVSMQQGLPIRTGDDAVPGFGAAVYRPNATTHESSSFSSTSSSSSLPLDQQRAVLGSTPALLISSTAWCMAALAVLLFVWGRGLHEEKPGAETNTQGMHHSSKEMLSRGGKSSTWMKTRAHAESIHAVLGATGWAMQGVVWGGVVLDSMPAMVSWAAGWVGGMPGGWVWGVLHSPARVRCLMYMQYV